MALSNTQTSYGAITRGFHWLTALLVITLIPIALIAQELPYETSEQLTRKAWMFSLHKTLGVSVFFVSLARIVWAITQPKPVPLHPDKKTETFLAETAHWLLYGSLVLAPLSGWIHHAATSGFAPIWWPLGQSLPLVPKSEAVSAIFGGAHWVFGKIMAATILLHVAGAVKHQIIDRDATLLRMLKGAPSPQTPQPPHHSTTPLLAALAIWVLTLATGAGFGLYSPKHDATQTKALQEVASDWQVDEGSIAIDVQQFGSTVSGSFSDWTADISFDPNKIDGIAGQVEVVIAVGSLTLGSVTDQAMGPDFFDQTTFPTANFTADIMAGIDGFEAIGTLTIKDQTIPINMPFRLSAQGGTANMQANLTLQRLDFGIGANMPDESSLAFAVEVNVALTATQTQ